MKRIFGLMIIITLCMVFALSACSPTAVQPGSQSTVTVTVPAGGTAVAPTVTKTVTATAPSAPSAVPATVYKWRCQALEPAGDARYTVGDAALPDFISKATGGRIQITMYPGGALVAATDQLEAVGGGTFEAQIGYGGYWESLIPAASIESTTIGPYKSITDFFRAYNDRGLVDVMREAYAPSKNYYVGIMVEGGVGMLSKKPLVTMADFKGLKVRTHGTEITAAFAALGATTTLIPMNEMYLAVSTGVVDAASTAWASLDSLKIWEVAKYQITPNVMPGSVHCVTVNLGVWNKLPADLQREFIFGQNVFAAWNARWQDAAALNAAAAITAHPGVQVSTMNPDVVKAYMNGAATVLDNIAKKDQYCAKAVTILKDFIAWRDRGYQN